MTLNIHTSALAPLQGAAHHNSASIKQSLTNIASKRLSSAENGIKVNLPTDFNLRVTEAFATGGIPRVADLRLDASVHKISPQKVEALL